MRIGRASSFDAAGITWRNASARAGAATRADAPATCGSCGKSSPGNNRRMKLERPPTIFTSSPSTSIVTADDSRLRTMSPSRRAGTTATPSVSPCTGTWTRIVSSRSEPTSSTESGVAVIRKPESTGRAPVRDVTARCAVVRASARVSRSQRNFTTHLRGRKREILVVVVVEPVDWGRGSVFPGQVGRACPVVVHRRPQERWGSSRVLPGRPPCVDDFPRFPQAYPPVPSRIRPMSSLTWSKIV